MYSLKQFNTELIVAATAQCIKFINSDADLPNTLPPGMSARFRMGASLANFVQVCFFSLFACVSVCQLGFFLSYLFLNFEQRYLQSSYVEACHGLWRRPDLPVPDISFFVYTEIHKSFLSLCSVLCCHRTWVTEGETWVTRHSYTPMKLRFVKSSCSLWRSFQKTHRRQRMNPWVSIWHDWSLLYAFYSEEDVCVCGGGWG